jgi:hypothetical protein
MQEFICPNGRMSVNGVCPIFEGDDGQIKDFQTPKTFDQKYNEIEDIKKEREKSGFFKFDFEKPTENAFEKADNIISKNIEAYNDFVEEKLGIPAGVQTAFRIGSSAYSALTGGSLLSVAAPFAIPFIAGAALNNQAQKEQEAAINRESVRDLQGRIDKGQFGSNTPTPQDKARTNYGGSTQSKGSIGSRGSGMSGYGGGADMSGGSPGSSGPGGSDEMGSF